MYAELADRVTQASRLGEHLGIDQRPRGAHLDLLEQPPRIHLERAIHVADAQAEQDVDQRAPTFRVELAVQRVLAVHPGKLLTEAAARDADTDPKEAARRLAAWLDRVDQETVCGLHDLMNGGLILW